MRSERGAALRPTGGPEERGQLDETQRLAITTTRLLNDWRAAHGRGLAYLDALGVPEDERAALVAAAIERAVEAPWEPGSDAVTETLRALRTFACGDPSGAGRSEFRAWRLRRLLGSDGPDPGGTDGVLPFVPALDRRSMQPEPVERRFLPRLFARGFRARQQPAPSLQSLYGSALRRLRRQLPWVRAAHRRRLLLCLLVLIPTTIASNFMVNVLPYRGGTWAELAIVVFFGALFGWISIGFWTAMIGFIVLVRGRDRFAITSAVATTTDPPDFAPPIDDAPAAGPATAIVMPICAEPVERVFAGLRAIHRSLERAGELDRVHFFVLSDTADPDLAVQEEQAWFDWCVETRGFGRIFYRRRKARVARKSGNVADFCRRFGRRYRYMVTLDADSVMAGATIVRLVELMNNHPSVGMIQTVPAAVGLSSLFARIQQFASHVYTPMFAAGLHWWQLGDGQYWGHNTIIRLGPFMDHCGLSKLPGREPLGGEILSHDFVEAALMGRAGWSLWLAYDVPGSWEEVPSALLDEMKRDRRWCQGNLQHLRLLFTEGLFSAHRMLFVNGALSYVSALLWFAFLTLSTGEAIQNALREPDYFPHGPSLFPEWPIWRPDWAMALIGVIAMILFLPKLLSIILVVVKRRAACEYGGVVRLSLSVVLEILSSSLLAPIRMVFHSRFVLLNLLGRTVGWGSQGRQDAETSWGEAVRRHGIDSVVASAWGVTLYWLNPGYFWWVTPVIGALLLSVPTSALASRVRLGDRARRLGLFLVPEERDVPPELRDVATAHAEALHRVAALPSTEQRDGLVRVAVDPYVNALHRAFLGRTRSLRPEIRDARREILERALHDGPAAIGTSERRVLLGDPDLVDELHERVWAIPDPVRAARWGRPGGEPPPTVAPRG
jgi:membrane glycosyltransferase